MVGRVVETESGRRLGRCRDMRAVLGNGIPRVEALVVGQRGRLEHFGIGTPKAHAPTPCPGRLFSALKAAGSSCETAPSSCDALPVGGRRAAAARAIGCRRAVEGSFRRMAAGAVEIAPRRRLGLEEGRLADMAASDLELGYACVKTYAGFAEGVAFLVALFATDRPELVALIEADHLGRLRTGAASAVAAKHLAREGATSLGVIGCGTRPRRKSCAFAQPFRRSSVWLRIAARSATCAHSASASVRSLRKATARRRSRTSS